MEYENLTLFDNDNNEEKNIDINKDTLKERMMYLIEVLNEANEAYYGDGEEIMSNKEYDDLYDELVDLETKSGIILSSSPTQNVGTNEKTKLPKEEHESPMLSLSKTKDIEEIKNFIGNNESSISWKMDGLTVVLKYSHGHLVKGLTRGNGLIGEVITDNVKVFKNVPLSIDYDGDLTVRGEALIKYSDFEKINEKLDPEDQYKNPRNLCSGSVRQLDSKVTKERNVYFYAFNLVSSEGIDFKNRKTNMFVWLKKLGFETVEYKIAKNRDDVDEIINYYKEKINTYDLPSDGLVIAYEDIEYSKSLGVTAKYPKDAIAFKWKDETKETKLIDVLWSPSRTGLINPVAIFDSVDLEGTSVNKASIHNVSIFKSLKLGIGDTLRVYKANMIIPQVLENLTMS
ncbi:MAG: NAD-dependent DNA ligase LigA, partial [Clostridia bacterium]|nr:NAD-dependent DNA ligase LigA [Clostridia bacterium]